MNKTVVGIDISKATVDVSFRREDGREEQQRYPQDLAGYAALVVAAPADSVMVMEATGVYYLRLAHYLYEHGQRVAVVNPLVVRRYGQMKLLRAKTDAADARLIAAYGRSETLSEWRPAAAVISRLQQLDSWLESVTREQTRLKNQQEALAQRPDADGFVRQAQTQRLHEVAAHIAACEQQLQQLAEQYYGEMYRRLRSIPGIGPKTAVKLIAVTAGFTRFATVEALVNYVGLCPRVFQSGTSVKGPGHIAKLGMGRLRQLLYLCSWSAKRCNAACRVLYDRLKAKGKPERVIKIAIAHKLVRQAFAVATKNEMYSEAYG
jgi:Transposase and inactivated derivatives